MKSYGEFIDTMLKVAKDTGNIDVELFIQEELEAMDKERLAKMRNEPLTSELVVDFASFISTAFIERTQNIDSVHLRNNTIESGHRFLRTTHSIATDSGIDIKLDEVDKPVTLTEALVRMGSIREAAKKRRK